MIINLKNPLGQIVGDYDTSTKTYTSIRNLRKGEIFVKKQLFNGKFYKVPIAIGLDILKRLLKMGCKRINILVMGVKEHSYMVSFTPEKILSEGTKINYDVVRQGKNITHFGNQIVFNLENGVDLSQNSLEKY